MEFHHVSVLLKELVSGVLNDRSGVYVDCTLGGGGHSRALGTSLTQDALLIGVDQDEDAIQAAGERLKDLPCRLKLVRDNFSHIGEVLDQEGIGPVNGFLFDLGVSSYQLDEGERGFSYMHDGALDMRMDQRNPLTAADIVNTYSEDELEKVIREYGEERWSRRIAKFIVAAREKAPLATTGELVQVIKAAVPLGARKDGPHPAKRTFQALRIEVNGELRILEETMHSCVDHLKPGGRIGVITFQSLEDRIIKNTFREMARDCICPPEVPVCVCHHHKTVRLVGKPVRPSEEEVENNPRARSATLRIVEKI